MEPLVTIHSIVAVSLVVLAAGVGIWGMARASAITDAARPREGKVFAQLLQLSHTLVLVAGLLGIALLVDDHRPADQLHSRVYGPFMLVALVAAYGYRTSDPRRNVRVFAVCSLVICALGLRALTTGG